MDKNKENSMTHQQEIEMNRRLRANDLINGNGYDVDGRKNKPIYPAPDNVVFISPDSAAELSGMLGIIASRELRQFGWYSANVNGINTLYVA